MKKILIIFFLFVLASCKQESELDGDRIFSNLQAVVMMDDYSALADELHPSVLESFRRRLEFSVEQPLEGSWFSGSREHSPTKEKLAQIDDRTFFVIYMKGASEVIGNPFLEGFRDAKIITSTVGTREYRHFVVQKEDTVAKPEVFSFIKSDGKWLLIGPSMVDNFANRLRAAKGRIPEG